MQRYSQTVDLITRNSKKKSYETLLYPEFPLRTTDIYIMANRMDRLDLLAYQYYADPRLWWVIARANTLPHGTINIPPGQRIRIPWPLSEADVLTLLKERQF